MKSACPIALVVLALPACADLCSDDGISQHCNASPMTTAVVTGSNTSSESGVVLETSTSYGSSDGTPGLTSSEESTASSGISTGDGSDETRGSSNTADTGTSSITTDGSADGSTSGPTDSDTGVASDVDLSGYILRQANSFHELVLPDDVVVAPGSTVVIIREATRDEFEAFWGRALGDDVVVVESAGLMPVCNGGETFTLLAPDRTIVDGPTLDLLAGTVMERFAANTPADDPVSWITSIDPARDATPGVADVIAGTSGTPVISEVADPLGSGAFAYEYVELYVIP